MTTYRYRPLCRTELSTQVRGDRPRRVCPAQGCGFVFWDNPAPVAAAIVERDDGVVLVRSRGAPATWFGLVAGFIESGETPAEAAVREVREEVGLAVQDPTFVGVHPFERRNQLLFTYHVRAPASAITLCEVELDAYRIVPLAELVPWNRGTGLALGDWLASRGYRRDATEFGQHIAP
jgi:NADH pyrophosphatase NudC (nudix superfamily)